MAWVTGTTKIESYRKRKIASVSVADQTGKENRKKKVKVSSSNRQGGGEGTKVLERRPRGRIQKVASSRAPSEKAPFATTSFQATPPSTRFTDCSSAKCGGDFGQF
ncbi:hypothetical protein E2542_SST22657 [Spatholobus suberectus]|nr:hypothetical protein E2542_SST22657 [Spatholobus suberectus]